MPTKFIFRKLLFAQAAVHLGNHLYTFLTLWWVLEISRSSAAAIGIFLVVTIANTLPAPVVGYLSVHHDKRLVLIWTRLLTVMMSISIAAFVWSEKDYLWVMYLLIAVSAFLDYLYSVIFSAIIPQLVDREDLSKANGWIETSNAVAGIISPAAAGLLLLWLGYAISFILTAFLFAVSWACLIGTNFAVSTVPKPLAQDLALGHRAVLNNFIHAVKSIFSKRWLLYLVAMPALANLAMAPLGALVPAAIKLEWGLGAQEAGVATAMFAAGVLVATQFFAWVRIPQRLAVLAATILFLGLGTLLTGLLAYPYLLLGSFLAGGGTIGLGITARTLLQLNVNHTLLGQTLATQRALRMALRPAGLMLGALLGEFLGARAAIGVLGIGLFFLGTFGLFLGLGHTLHNKREVLDDV